MTSQNSSRYMDECRYLQQQYNELSQKHDTLIHKHENQSLMLKNANDQIIRLNGVLRNKEQ